MTREEFIDFIKEIGFTQSWTTNPDNYTLLTDKINPTGFIDALVIYISEGSAHLSVTQNTTQFISGRSFGKFTLDTFGKFGDFQQELFISFIKGSFGKVPENITEYLRDKKIKDILN